MEGIKAKYCVFALIMLALGFSCTTDSNRFNVQAAAPSVDPTYEIDLNHDTINRIDHTGLKQGRWIKYTPINIVDKLRKIEEGKYVNDKKEGYWKFYLPDGVLKDSVLYRNGVIHY